MHTEHCEHLIGKAAKPTMSLVFCWLECHGHDVAALKAAHWRDGKEAFIQAAVDLGMPEFGSAL